MNKDKKEGITVDALNKDNPKLPEKYNVVLSWVHFPEYQQHHTFDLSKNNRG